MSTTGRERHSVLRIFKGRRNAPTPRDAAVLFQPLDPTSAEPFPGFNDLHVSIAAGLHQSFLWLRPAQA
ncbi:unnamed protein product [Brassica napus]|uniref:(rape) hypothetical protein n=1 Tax=Brassica napus TaxID=3708 RepID=A0A816SK23_BRANA|nr:unnamed protein product [Brassica napus]